MAVTKLFSLPYIFLYIWFIYHLQGAFYTLNGALSMGLFGLQIIISVYCWIYACYKYRFGIYMRALNFLSIYLIGAGLYRFIENDTVRLTLEQGGAIVNSMDYFRQYVNSLLPIFVFYVSYKRGSFTDRDIRLWLIPFILLATTDFLKYSYLHLLRSDAEEFTNNTGYIFASIIPATLFFVRKPKLQLVLLGYCMVFVLLSMKRGAILTGGLATCFCLYQMIKTSRKGKIWIIVGVAAFLWLAYWYIENYMLQSEYFMYRLEQTLDGNSSNRDYLYSTLWNHIVYHMEDIRWLFGYGADGSVRVLGQFAHNDWFEIFIDLGLIGLALYIFYWVSLFKTCIKLRKRDHFLYIVLCAVIIVYFIKTFMSMSINDMSIYVTCILGCVMAQADRLFIGTHRETIKRA